MESERVSLGDKTFDTLLEQIGAQRDRTHRVGTLHVEREYHARGTPLSERTSVYRRGFRVPRRDYEEDSISNAPSNFDRPKNPLVFNWSMI